MVRPEAAQIVWRRALELAGPRAFHDRFANALELLRAAHHDPATMAHALTIGRTELRHDSANAVARSAAGILEEAIVFLGVKPRADDIARPRSAGTASHRRRPTSGAPVLRRP